jgi:leucyl-tRNA synthetase
LRFAGGYYLLKYVKQMKYEVRRREKVARENGRRPEFFAVKTCRIRRKFYALIEFPYPAGNDCISSCRPYKPWT